MQPARANVLRLLVHDRGVARDFADRVVGEAQVDFLCREQRRVLHRERVFRLAEDAHEIVFGERLQLDANGEAALQLRYEVGWLRDVKSAGSNEQYMISLYHSIFRVDRGPFDDRQQVALHSLA